MYKRTRMVWLAVLGILSCFTACAANSSEAITKAPPAPEMPADWKVVSDFDVPPDQAKPIAEKLGVRLSSLRNTLYDVNGKSVQLNVIIVADEANADRLMAKLKTMKGEVALLRQGLTVYEFVGKNDVLSIIAEGREHLEAR